LLPVRRELRENPAVRQLPGLEIPAVLVLLVLLFHTTKEHTETDVIGKHLHDTKITIGIAVGVGNGSRV